MAGSPCTPFGALVLLNGAHGVLALPAQTEPLPKPEVHDMALKAADLWR